MNILLKSTLLITTILLASILFTIALFPDAKPKCAYFYSINPSGYQKLICVIHDNCYWIYDNPFASFYIYPMECEI